MGQFLTTLIVEPVDCDNWRLVRPLEWRGADGQHFVVPEGHLTDFFSIPWLFRRLLPKAQGVYTKASVLHDWLYWTQPVPREQADAYFREAMIDTGTPAWRRELMFAAVRMFGGRAWREAQRERAAERAKVN